MLNGSKKYRRIKFLNVDQKFLNPKVLNKKKALKSISINTVNSSNKSKEKLLKSSVVFFPFKIEEEKNSKVKNIDIKRSNKRVYSCRKIDTIKNSNIFKNIKKMNFEEKKDGEAFSNKLSKSRPKRVYSLRNYTSCKKVNLKSSLFNTNVKSSLFKRNNQTTKSLTKNNNNINNYFKNYKNANENEKKTNKVKNKKVVNKNINEKDCANIITIKFEKLKFLIIQIIKIKMMIMVKIKATTRILKNFFVVYNIF